MKTELKKKTDRRVTGNKIFKLKEWEKNLLGLLQGERWENPSIRQIPGVTSSGVPKRSVEDQLKSQLPLRPPPPKKMRLCAETEEIKSLTNGELQRLVLLEQLTLLRLQIDQIKNNVN
ncbi:hypothetical protein FQR65_LT16836 [Abscondita terminalis]|nr:hypothetical protein FQR65_LT16836 [Abscondita terminalis]